MITTLETGVWAVGNREYHEDKTHVSHSALEVFRQSAPLYYGRYVTGEIPRPQPTAAMEFGSCFEALLLEPDNTDVYVIAPQINRRTNAGKEAWAEWEGVANGRIILRDDDHLLMEEMRASVMANDGARFLVDAPGIVQQAIRWTDTHCDIPLKAKFDKLFLEGIIVDLKTAEDPSPDAFRRQCVSYGYHRQAAMYLDGAKAVFDSACQFLFLVVGKKPPHETIIYELDHEAVRLGRIQNEEMLYELARRRESGNWAGRWSEKIEKLSLPKWAFYEEST